MKKTKKYEITEDRLLVDLKDLMRLCGCGQTSALDIARSAEATVRVGDRRVFFNLNKIKAYIDSISS